MHAALSRLGKDFSLMPEKSRYCNCAYELLLSNLCLALFLIHFLLYLMLPCGLACTKTSLCAS